MSPNFQRVDVGLALPQYDSSIPGHPPRSWGAVAASAAQAEALGFGSVWLSDARARPGFDPIVVLGALARLTTTVGLGAQMSTPRRPATVLTKALATVDILSGGRLTVGLGAGAGDDDRSDEALARLDEALEVLRGMFGGGPFSFDGRFEHAVAARCLPRPAQRPHPPLWISGTGDDRLLEIVARQADGWATAWTGTTDGWRDRSAVLDAACEKIGRNPRSVTRSVGLRALVGEDEADLGRRFERLRKASMPEVLAGVDSAAWRDGGLVGTVEQVKDQVEVWQGLGVTSLVLTAGAVPFAPVRGDDMELIATACRV